MPTAPLTWFDAHCHFDFSALDEHRETDWALAHSMGVSGIIVPGVSRRQSESLVEFVQRHPYCHRAVGLHPYWCAQHAEDDLDWLDGNLQHSVDKNSVVAVGELGMDRHLIKSHGISWDEQWRWCMAQIELAERHKKPLILHIRGAHDEVAAELKRRRFTLGGLVHAFSGSLQQGLRWHELGFALGVGGAMTHPRSTRLRNTLRDLPIESLLLETDSPDMRPAFLGRTENSTAMIPLYSAILASIKAESLAEFSQKLQQNLYRVFPSLTVNSSENDRRKIVVS